MINISVIVPFRNAAAHIDACIASLLSQTYPAERFEVIMVDNGSADRSAELVQEHPGVQLLSESDSGPYAARNRGVEQARGRILAFTDADCVAEPEWLQVIADAMRDNPTAGILQGDRHFGAASPLLSLLAAYDSEKAALAFSSRDPDVYYAYAGNMAIRRNLFDELGPFRRMQNGADVVFVQKAIRTHSCDVVRHCPDARVRHLEITSQSDWLRKLFTYGRSYEHYRTVANCRPLNTFERLRVLRRVASRQRWAVALVLMVPAFVPGVVSYELGRLVGRRRERSSHRPGRHP